VSAVVATESGWNFADVWERIADRFADQPAAFHLQREYN
jgi:hypothetical protein